MSVVRRRSKRQQELIQTLTFFSFIIVLIGGLIGYLWVYMEVDETLLNIELHNTTARALNNELKELRSEIDYLSRVDVISKKARADLDMVPAAPETLVVYIDRDAIEGWND